MKSLPVWQKLALMGAVFMLPFAIVTYKMTSSINTMGVEFARQELRGLEYYTPALLLVQHLQQHRALAAGWLNGLPSFKEPLAAKTAEIENDLQQLDEVNRRLDGVLHTSQQWAAVQAASRDLLDRTPRLSPADSVELHIKVIGETIALIAHVGDVSNLTHDPGIDSNYLMDILIHQGPQLSEILGQARAVGSNLTASKKGTPDDFARLNRLSVIVEFLQKRVSESHGKAFTYNETLRPELAAGTSASADAVQHVVGYIRGVITKPLTETSATDYVAALTQSIDTIFAMENQVTRSLVGLLNSRVAKFQREVLFTIGSAALGLLLVSAVSFVIVRDITVTLRHVVGVANQIAASDLAVRIAPTSRKDEFGALVRAFDRMVTTLSSFVGQVQASGLQVNASVTEIAATAREQQATATEIAATTTEIGATSREIASTSYKLVGTIVDVAQAAEFSADLAGQGQAGLSHMEETMQRVMDATGSINAKLAVLSDKAGNISEVVTTITKIADQTNLLSLNAAIEAEKAGEYGLGFAVVATEIRRLADQTAVATYDIDQMVKDIQSAVVAGVMGMNTFSEEVRRGLQDVRLVGGQLSQVIHQVQALAPRVESVNGGMQGQASGAEQITQALTQLSEAAHQTVDSLRQSGQAIDELNRVAIGLTGSVSRFTLRAA